jgi:general transcriptional corepressor CYC8
MTAADAAARDRDDRPPSAMKRGREWDSVEGGPAKKIANEENRLRQADEINRRVTPPRDLHRRSSSEIRRANENYHPSEAAHHLHTLPSIQHMQQPGGPSIPPLAEAQPVSNPPSAGPEAQAPVKEETVRKEPAPLHEPAARKMDVDEDYDDDGDDEKRATGIKGSPHGNGTASASNGSFANGNGAAKPEAA